MPYWQPTHAETMKLLGWRWLLALPALAMVALTIVGLVLGNPFLAYNTCGFPRMVMAWQWARQQIERGV